MDITIFDFIRDILLLKSLENRNVEYIGHIKQFVMTFQQYTAPVMVKGHGIQNGSETYL